jgi:hypothetical protein
MTAAQDERRAVSTLYGPSTRSGTVTPAPSSKPINNAAANRAGSAAA